MTKITSNEWNMLNHVHHTIATEFFQKILDQK